MIDLSKIRVLWAHPYNGWLYGIPYDMRADINQSPTDIWRAPSCREDCYSFFNDGSARMYRDSRSVGEVIPKDWVYLDVINDEQVRRWIRRLRDADPGIVPSIRGEWSTLEPHRFEADSMEFGWTDTIGGA